MWDFQRFSPDKVWTVALQAARRWFSVWGTVDGLNAEELAGDVAVALTEWLHEGGDPEFARMRAWWFARDIGRTRLLQAMRHRELRHMAAVPAEQDGACERVDELEELERLRRLIERGRRLLSENEQRVLSIQLERPEESVAAKALALAMPLSTFYKMWN